MMNSNSVKVCILFLLLANFTFAQNKKPESFSFIAFGDMPYFLPQDLPRFDNVIKTINDQNTAFSICVGDIKSGSTPCTDDYYTKILNYFKQFKKPLMYIPGDNEWTDCSRPLAGSFDPEERLEVIRKMFFKDKMSFGLEKISLTSQSLKPEFSKFVENNYWEYGNIAFGTVHIVGSNNNFLSSSKNGNKEFFEREKADTAWLKDIFAKARTNNNSAIVIIIHADMFEDSKDMKEASGFNSVKKKMQELATDFKKPVLLINGDSHVLLIDKPLYVDIKTEKSLVNFTRLQVEGESNMNVVKITVNPESSSVFQFEEIHVPGN